MPIMWKKPSISTLLYWYHFKGTGIVVFKQYPVLVSTIKACCNKKTKVLS